MPQKLLRQFGSPEGQLAMTDPPTQTAPLKSIKFLMMRLPPTYVNPLTPTVLTQPQVIVLGGWLGKQNELVPKAQVAALW